jgi:hypothetical protein
MGTHRSPAGILICGYRFHFIHRRMRTGQCHVADTYMDQRLYPEVRTQWKRALELRRDELRSIAAC